MQPRFPPEHHFHRRHRKPKAAPDDLAARTDEAVAHLIRQCLPAFDASDPRGHA